MAFGIGFPFGMQGTGGVGGDITSTPPIDVPNFTSTLALIDAPVGTTYNVNVAALNTGGSIATYSLNGTLPAGLSLNTSSGFITGTTTTEATYSGYSITGTNATGTDTTNTDSVIISAAPSLVLDIAALNTYVRTDPDTAEVVAPLLTATGILPSEASKLTVTIDTGFVNGEDILSVGNALSLATTFTGGVLTINLAQGGTAFATFDIQETVAAGTIRLGREPLVSELIITSYDVVQDGGTFAIVIQDSATTTTLAQVQAILRTVEYKNTIATALNTTKPLTWAIESSSTTLASDTDNYAMNFGVLPEAVPIIGTLALPAVTVGDAYSYTVPFTGGTPTSGTLVSGTLSNGITFNTATWTFEGTVTGTAGTISGVSVSLTNTGGTSATSNTDDIVVSAVSAQVLTLGGTNEYLSLSPRQDITTSGVTLTFDFLMSGGNPAVVSHFADSEQGLGSEINLYVQASGRMRYTDRGSVTVDGASVTIGQDIGPDNTTNYLDGAWHTLVFTHNGVATTELSRFGANHFGAECANISIRNISLDLTPQGGGVTTWAMDSGSTTTEAPTVDGNALGNITLVNVESGDWA